MNAREVRRLWAHTLIQRGRQNGEIPRYGSVEWCELPDGDPRKVAAVVVAAECWSLDDEFLADRLHAEIATARMVDEQEDVARWAQAAEGVRHLADVPTIAALRELDDYVFIECAGKAINRVGQPYPCPTRIRVQWAPGWMGWRMLCATCEQRQQAAS